MELLEDPYEAMRELSERVIGRCSPAPRDQDLALALWQYWAACRELPEPVAVVSYVSACARDGRSLLILHDGLPARPTEYIAEPRPRPGTDAAPADELTITRVRPTGGQQTWTVEEPATGLHHFRARSRRKIAQWLRENYGGRWVVTLDDPIADRVRSAWTIWPRLE